MILGMRLGLLFGFLCWVGLSYAGSVGPERSKLGGDISPVMYYDAERHALVIGPVERGGDIVEVLNVIGQKVVTFTLRDPANESTRLAILSLPSLPAGLYYARWIQNGQVYQVRRFSVT